MGDSAGDFEKLMLLAVLRLGNEAYGAAIIDEVGARTKRDVSPGAVYVALRRLEDKGMLRSRTGEPTPERGGRARRYYEVRRDGLGVLKTAHEEWSAMAEGLDALLESDS